VGGDCGEAGAPPKNLSLYIENMYSRGGSESRAADRGGSAGAALGRQRCGGQQDAVAEKERNTKKMNLNALGGRASAACARLKAPFSGAAPLTVLGLGMRWMTALLAVVSAVFGAVQLFTAGPGGGAA
jgi:hypothetical protein